MKNIPIKGKTKLIGFLQLYSNVDISYIRFPLMLEKVAIRRYLNFLGIHLQYLTIYKDKPSFI